MPNTGSPESFYPQYSELGVSSNVLSSSDTAAPGFGEHPSVSYSYAAPYYTSATPDVAYMTRASYEGVGPMPLAFPPRRSVATDRTFVSTGPLPAADYSFGTGGRRSTTVLSADLGVSSEERVVSVSDGMEGVIHESKDHGSPGTTSNKTTTPLQMTPKQTTPTKDETDSMEQTDASIIPAVTEELNELDQLAVQPPHNHDVSLSEAARLAEGSGQTAISYSTSNVVNAADFAPSRPAHNSRLRAIMPHPLAPSYSPSSSASLSSYPPSASSSHSTFGQYPFASSWFAPSISTNMSSRFGSIDSGSVSLFSTFGSSAEESVSSVPPSDSGGSYFDDLSIGGVFERDVERIGPVPTLSSAAQIELHKRSMMPGPSAGLSPTSPTTARLGAVMPVSAAQAHSSEYLQVPMTSDTRSAAPLGYPLDVRRASCPGLVDPSLGNSEYGEREHSGGLSSQAVGSSYRISSFPPPAAASSSGEALSSRQEQSQRPPVPTPIWDPPLTAARRDIASSSASSPLNERDILSSAPTYANRNISQSSTTSKHQLIHSLLKMPSAPILTNYQHSTTFAPPTISTSGRARTLDLGPAYHPVPDWERVQPPSTLYPSPAPPTSASPQDHHDPTSREDLYPEAMIPLGESPASTSGGGGGNVPFSPSPLTQAGWSASDYPSVTVWRFLSLILLSYANGHLLHRHRLILVVRTPSIRPTIIRPLLPLLLASHHHRSWVLL